MAQITGIFIEVVIAAPTGLMSDALCAFVRAIPGVEVTAQTASLAATERALTRTRAQLLLLDDDLPGPVLAAAIRQFRADFPGLSIIVLASGHRQLDSALQAGAGHAILKGQLDHQLRQAIVSHPCHPPLRPSPKELNK